MRSLRSIGAAVLVVFASLGVVASTPNQADAYHYRWYGGYNYPYYWNNGGYNSFYNPYRAYNPYYNWYGNYGGYYGSYPYYSWYRAYPWGWYW